MVIRTEVKFYTVITALFSVTRGIDLFLYSTAGMIPQRNVQRRAGMSWFSAFAYLILHYKPMTGRWQRRHVFYELSAPPHFSHVYIHPVFHLLHYFLIASLASKKNKFEV
jgi:hypothetical protein